MTTPKLPGRDPLMVDSRERTPALPAQPRAGAVQEDGSGVEIVGGDILDELAEFLHDLIGIRVLGAIGVPDFVQ